MYWCINVWYTYVSIKDCGLKLNTPWNVREGVNTPTFGVRRVFPKCLKGVIHRLKFIPVKSHKCLTFYGYESHTKCRHTITKFRLLFLPFRWQFCCRHILRCEKLQYAFPICDDPSLIGYHINKMSFNKLGESNCLTQVRGREHVSRDVTWRDVRWSGGREGRSGDRGREGSKSSTILQTYFQMKFLFCFPFFKTVFGIY